MPWPATSSRFSAIVLAPHKAFYALIADYCNGHPHITPKRYFRAIVVERGGIGDGTVIRFQMRVFGMWHTLRAEIAEPEPGRVLVEKNIATGDVSTFTVEPVDEERTQVTIAAELQGGWLTRIFHRVLLFPFLRRVITEELQQLERVARERAATQAMR